MIKNAIPLVIILASAQLWGQDIAVEPIFFGIYRSSGGIWQGEDKPIRFAGWGVRGNVEYGRWGLDADLILMRFFGLDNLPNRFSPEQGFSWQSNATGVAEELDTDYSSMKMTYRAGGFTAMLGKFSQSWGPGLHSLTVSEKPPTYPQFGFDWRINEKLRFSYYHGDLYSQIEDSLATLYSGMADIRSIYLDRYIATHRLEWSPVVWLTVGLVESVVYGARSIETIYLMPFMSIWSAEHYLGDTDNVQMSADLAWQPRPGLKFYGVFMMDEWRPEVTFKETNHNWFAWQGGLDWRSILLDEDHLVMEVTWTDHRINQHRFPINDFSSHGYPIGHWIGAHAQSLLASYILPGWGSRFMVSYLYAKRGDLTWWDMPIGQYNPIPYDRFSGSTETIQTFDVIVARPVWRKLWLEIGVSRIWWVNTGFNPAEPESGNLEDVDKTSFNVGFYYNFDLPGYAVSRLISR